MFEFGRELMKLIAGERSRPFADGLTGGDSTLLELLDLSLLLQEAKGADVAAGRIGAKDKAQLRLDAAVVWREVARRSGDAVALRKAAATAEAAFREARNVARGGIAAALADVGLAIVEARQDMAKGDQDAAHRAYGRFNSPIAALDALSRRVAAARPLAAEARLARADLLCGWGARLKDETLLNYAVQDAATAAERMDSGYEPLTWARAEIMRGQALALWGEAAGDVDAVATGATALAAALDHLTRDHSPLDWARTQIALAQALQALGEASADERAFEQAVTCYDRANVVLKDAPSVPLRGLAAGARAMCLARSAELTGDLGVLDAAEAAMKIELSNLRASRDPIAWALAQLHLARLYEARIDITGKDRGERAAAVTALDAALDVFGEEGLRSLSVVASEALERLRSGPARPRTAV
jgi:tetratricopeptide (TPR) repeat protein